MGFLAKLLGPRAPRVQPTHVDDATFVSEVLRSKLPVVLDVWSPGCAPCRMLESVVMDLAAEYAGRVKVAELNAAEEGSTAARYGVMGTPTVLFFRNGREVERVVGFVGSRYLREIVESELLSAPASVRSSE
jgi:thioredoxin 1